MSNRIQLRTLLHLINSFDLGFKMCWTKYWTYRRQSKSSCREFNFRSYKECVWQNFGLSFQTFELLRTFLFNFNKFHSARGRIKIRFDQNFAHRTYTQTYRHTWGKVKKFEILKVWNFGHLWKTSLQTFEMILTPIAKVQIVLEANPIKLVFSIITSHFGINSTVS